MKPTIVSIVGARPNFVKLAALSPEIRKVANEIIIHTGQHYDYNMNEIFFKDLDIPEPDHHLEVGSGSHAWQTSLMILGIEEVLVDNTPDAVVVYGDTNTTLAGAVAASKLHVPVIHIESGLRSRDRLMPEEINRVIVDNISDVLFCPTWKAYKNIEALQDCYVHVVGDVIVDLINKGISDVRSTGDYYLLTIHREENDSIEKLKVIFNGLSGIGEEILFPCHPRIRKHIESLNLPKNINVVEPIGYLHMRDVERRAKKIITDSGGIQKEAYLLGVPCITLRDSTEWVETLSGNWNIITGANEERIKRALETSPDRLNYQPEQFGVPGVCGRIARIIVDDVHRLHSCSWRRK